MQRVVIDARPANRWFDAPPSTSLPSGSAFARIQASSAKGLYFSGLDLKDFFYHLALPEELSDFFSFPQLRPVFYTGTV